MCVCTYVCACMYVCMHAAFCNHCNTSPTFLHSQVPTQIYFPRTPKEKLSFCVAIHAYVHTNKTLILFFCRLLKKDEFSLYVVMHVCIYIHTYACIISLQAPKSSRYELAAWRRPTGLTYGEICLPIGDALASLDHLSKYFRLVFMCTCLWAESFFEHFLQTFKSHPHVYACMHPVWTKLIWAHACTVEYGSGGYGPVASRWRSGLVPEERGSTHLVASYSFCEFMSLQWCMYMWWYICMCVCVVGTRKHAPCRQLQFMWVY